MSNFVYTKAPLVEVIAELFWKTIPLEIVPGGSIDPAYHRLVEPFTGEAAKLGLRKVEPIVPGSMPVELFAGRPTIRFRPDADQWPLLQIGPGIFVANIVPPYNGWPEFRKFLTLGTAALDTAWPLGDRPTITKLRLRYIDAFTKVNGYVADASFLSNGLKLGAGIPAEVLARLSCLPESAEVRAATSFAVASPVNGTATFSGRQGKSQDQDAYIADFAIETPESGAPSALADVVGWFDLAHDFLRNAFLELVSPDLETTFGARIPVTRQ